MRHMVRRNGIRLSPFCWRFKVWWTLIFFRMFGYYTYKVWYFETQNWLHILIKPNLVSNIANFEILDECRHFFFWVFSSGQSWKLSTWTRQYRWRQMLSSRSKHYECPQTLWSLSVAPTERLTRVCKLQTDQIKQLLPTSRIFHIGC